MLYKSKMASCFRIVFAEIIRDTYIVQRLFELQKLALFSNFEVIRIS